MEDFGAIPITCVQYISKAEFIENYYKPQRPVLIKGMAKNWPAYSKWNLDYIQDRAGDQIVPLYDSKPTKGRQNSAAPATEMKLYDYLELIKTKPTNLRVFFYNILERMPELIKDFKYPDIGLKFFKKLPVLFFGGEGSKVLTHYDMDLADLLHIHFHGTKSIMLFSPEQSKYLYRVPFSVHNLERINMGKSDFEKYPALRKLRGIQVHLKHGDALYMPSGYWHFIKYLEGGFSITLRALPTKPKKLLNTLYNVFFMRNFENLMRKTFGQKWVDYKETKIINRTNRKFGQLQA